MTIRIGLPSLLLSVLVLYGCSPVTDPETPRVLGTSNSATFRAELIFSGKAAYATYCAGCHGETGDGNGPAAGFMHPRPRNFQEPRFRFSSTRAGQLPTDDDLKRTITKGLKGSAMPAWPLLPEYTVDAVIAYIKTLSPRWQDRRPASPVPLVDDPYRALADKSKAIQRGETIYHGYATCWTCHPAYLSEELINQSLVAMENPTREVFRPRLFEAEIKVNVEEQFTFPPDFKRDFVRAGTDVDDLYRSIAGGITGTAMPTWVDSMEFRAHDGTLLTRVDDIWAVSYYVRSLIQQRPAKLTAGQFKVRDRRQVLYFDGEMPPPAVLPDTTPEGDPFEDEEFSEDEEL